MHKPTTDPGPAVKPLIVPIKSRCMPFRKGQARVFYKLMHGEDCCGHWIGAEIQWVEWAMSVGSDVGDVTDMEKDELSEYIMDKE